MSNENNTLTPEKIKLINNVSGAYVAPFWEGLWEISGTLATVRKIKAVLETLCSTGNELEPYPDAIKRFIIEFLLDTHDLMIDYETEE